MKTKRLKTTWLTHEYKTADKKWHVTIKRREWHTVAVFQQYSEFYEKYMTIWEWDFPEGTACNTPPPILADMIQDRIDDNGLSDTLRVLIEE
jgi:hypothetical protein